MRSIHQHGTNFISIPRKSDDSDCYSVIYKSKSVRTTERDALSPAYKGKPYHIVADIRPGLDYHLCNSCGDYVHSRGFTPDKRNRNGLDYVCKSCRAEQRSRHREAQRRMYLSRNSES